MTPVEQPQVPVKRKKFLHIEFLRFLCIWLVMFTHTATDGFSLYLTKQDSLWFPLYLFVPFWIKTAVPIFFMISGALLLGKNEPIHVIFKRRVFRFAIVLVLFSFINYLISYCHLSVSQIISLIPHPLALAQYFWSHISLGQFAFLTYTSSLATAYYFLYIYIAFLFMLPLWRAMVRNLTNQTYLYLIVLNLCFVGIIPIVNFLLFKGSAQINYFLNPLLAVSEPSFYFIIGYWIEHVLPPSWITRRNLAFLGLAALCGTIISALMTIYHGMVANGLTEAISERFYDCFLFLNTAFVFCLARYIFLHIHVSFKIEKILIFLGSVSFGIMLFDDVLRHATNRLFTQVFLPAMPNFPLAAAILWIITTFSCGIILSWLIRKLPYMKKLI